MTLPEGDPRLAQAAPGPANAPVHTDGPYLRRPELIPMTELAAALGAPNSPEAVGQAVSELCKTLIIRNGYGHTSSFLRTALSIPESTELKLRPIDNDLKIVNTAIDKPWLDFSEILGFHQGSTEHPYNNGFIYAPIRHAADRETFLTDAKTNAKLLVDMCAQARYQAIPEELAILAQKIPPHAVQSTLKAVELESDSPRNLINITRQIKLLRELGPEWTRLTRREVKILERASNPNVWRAVDLLIPTGLIWRRSETHGTFGPSLPYSRFHTFYDMTSKGFDEAIKKLEETRPRHFTESVVTLMRKLQEVRRDGECGEFGDWSTDESKKECQKRQAMIVGRHLSELESARNAG